MLPLLHISEAEVEVSAMRSQGAGGRMSIKFRVRFTCAFTSPIQVCPPTSKYGCSRSGTRASHGTVRSSLRHNPIEAKNSTDWMRSPVSMNWSTALRVRQKHGMRQNLVMVHASDGSKQNENTRKPRPSVENPLFNRIVITIASNHESDR